MTDQKRLSKVDILNSDNHQFFQVEVKKNTGSETKNYSWLAGVNFPGVLVIPEVEQSLFCFFLRVLVNDLIKPYDLI